MLNRREFITCSLSAGVMLGVGSMVMGCSGLNRLDLPGLQETSKHLPMLDDTAKAILYHASLAPSGHNSQPWRVRVESPETWVIEADAQRRLPVVDPENRETMLSLGAFVENLSLAAGGFGVATEIEVIAKDCRDKDVVRVKLHRDKPNGFPLERIKKRRTVKHGLIARELKSADVKTLSAQLAGHLFYFPAGSEHASFIQDAAVESFRIQTHRDDAQQELVRWLRLNNRDARRYRDGLTTEGMEIFGLKGWFVRHLIKPADFLNEGYRNQGIDQIQELARQGGGWFVLTSKGRTVKDLIETGRRFECMALLACEHGIGIHPMTQVLEEKSGLSLLTVHHGADFFPQFVLRVGYLENYPKPVSLRRPPEWFVYS